MEVLLPPEIAQGLSGTPARRKPTGWMVVAGRRRLPILEHDSRGFAVAADGGPLLRGHVGIMEKGRIVERQLVVFSGIEDGLLRYDYKRSGHGGQVPADHVLPLPAGLLSGPSD